MFSCRFCDLIFCLIDLNWKQLMEKKSERNAISGSFLSLRYGLPFPLSQKRKTEIHALAFPNSCGGWPWESNRSPSLATTSWLFSVGSFEWRLNRFWKGKGRAGPRRWGWLHWGGRPNSDTRVTKRQIEDRVFQGPVSIWSLSIPICSYCWPGRAPFPSSSSLVTCPGDGARLESLPRWWSQAGALTPE